MPPGDFIHEWRAQAPMERDKGMPNRPDASGPAVARSPVCPVPGVPGTPPWRAPPLAAPPWRAVRERDKESPHQSVTSGQRPEARSAGTELAPGCEAAGGQPENEDRGAERRHPFLRIRMPRARSPVCLAPPPLTPHRTPPAWDGAHAVGETPTGRRRRRRSRYTGSPTQRKTRPIRCGRKADPTHPRRGDRRRV